jgi:hypothetical protein
MLVRLSTGRTIRAEAYYAGVDAHAQMLDRLMAMCGSCESYSDVILRPVEIEATHYG